MRMFLFSVRDIKADQFSNPFSAVSPGAAIRGFSDAVNGKDEAFSSHPADYELYLIASFDTDTGVITLSDKERKAHGIDLVAPKRSDNLEMFPTTNARGKL